MSSLRGLKRTEFPLSVRKKAFARCCRDGIPHCESCELLIRGTPIFEHDQADGLGGEPTLENCKVHCRICADIKTVTEDNPRMAKADRVMKKHHGLRSSRKPIQARGFEKREPQRTASRPIERRR